MELELVHDQNIDVQVPDELTIVDHELCPLNYVTSVWGLGDIRPGFRKAGMVSPSAQRRSNLIVARCGHTDPERSNHFY